MNLADDRKEGEDGRKGGEEEDGELEDLKMTTGCGDGNWRTGCPQDFAQNVEGGDEKEGRESEYESWRSVGQDNDGEHTPQAFGGAPNFHDLGNCLKHGYAYMLCQYWKPGGHWKRIAPAASRTLLLTLPPLLLLLPPAAATPPPSTFTHVKVTVTITSTIAATAVTTPQMLGDALDVGDMAACLGHGFGAEECEGWKVEGGNGVVGKGKGKGKGGEGGVVEEVREDGKGEGEEGKSESVRKLREVVGKLGGAFGARVVHGE